MNAQSREVLKVGWDPRQPDLVEGSCGKVVETIYSLNPIPFYAFMVDSHQEEIRAVSQACLSEVK